MDLDSDLFKAVYAALRHIHSIGVITGAGISADSGIPTYRGEGGIYRDPQEGQRTIEALSIETLMSEPARTWGVLDALRQRAAASGPNAAHHAIAEIERITSRFALLTQNVDGLHQAAGSRNMIDIHGDAHRMRCVDCDRVEAVPEKKEDIVPKCSCGGWFRPDVVLFGELLPIDKVAQLQREFVHHIPDLVLIIGTTAAFPYIAEPVVRAREQGHLTIEINPTATALTEIVDIALPYRAVDAVPLIAHGLKQSNDAGINELLSRG